MSALPLVALVVAVVVVLLVAVAAFACCVYSKILNKLLPHLQLKKSMQNTKIHKLCRRRRRQRPRSRSPGQTEIYIQYTHNIYT